MRFRNGEKWDWTIWWAVIGFSIAALWCWGTVLVRLFYQIEATVDELYGPYYRWIERAAAVLIILPFAVRHGRAFLLNVRVWFYVRVLQRCPDCGGPLEVDHRHGR